MGLKLQECLNRLKIIDKQLQALRSDFEQMAAWRNNAAHPLGKVGTDEYSKKEAEKKMKSKQQKYIDLIKRYNELKIAIMKTNLETYIEVDDVKMSIAEAIIMKNQGVNQRQTFVQSIEQSKRQARQDVEYWNRDNPNSEKKADVWYLVNQEEIEKIGDFVNTFIEEVDAKLQIANATTDIIGLPEE